ncbi:MAG TPA: transcriptional regulator [Saprospiraceae bacterium]|nr:transcriptional regulator [Saprospiraceae bacterium]HNL40510.1 transcriptional regulator [Saprospiraceae bacterium]HNM23981.1 transcriptional regulator [Saprospiraceae bacterium]
MPKDLDPLFLSQLRLAIMSHLMVMREAEFNAIKTHTGATAGNLSAQIAKLQEAGYIDVVKTYKGNYPLTVCKLTPAGVAAFEAFYENLKTYF